MSERIAIEANDWHAEVCPDAGANFACVRYRGQDLLRPWSAQETNPFLAGAPLLLPANRTAGGRFSFAGKEYVLPVNEPFSGAHLHGELHRQRFQVCAQERDRVELEYENARTVYPFPFRIRIAYRVGVQGLVSEYHLENLASTDMPLTFALHTTFVEPDWFQVPLKALQERDERYMPTGRILPLTVQQRTYCSGSPSRGRSIIGYYQSAGGTARIGAHLIYRVFGFDHWVLYNGGGTAGYLCVEPQLGAVNGLNDPANCPVIRKGQVLSLKTCLEWLE